MAKSTTEKVKKYKVAPSWGNKNLKIVAETCVQSGKTLFTKNSGWRSTRLFDTPAEAIDDRIEDCLEQLAGVSKEAIELKDTIKQLKEMKKAIK